MATKYQIVSQNGITHQTYKGFAWTCLFFGALPALFRKDIYGFLIMFIAALATAGFSQLIFIFFYNKMHRAMLEQAGWKVVGKEDGHAGSN